MTSEIYDVCNRLEDDKKRIMQLYRTRELSIAITKIDEARLWLLEAVKLYDHDRLKTEQDQKLGRGKDD